MNKRQESAIRFRKKMAAIKQHKEPYTWKVLGQEFTIFPNVFNPGKDADLLAKLMKIKDGTAVLDLGTGCGVLGIFAAKNASKVILTDINPDGVKNAKYNVKKFGLDKKMEVRKGDLFRPIKQSEKFDVIIFNPPFGNEKPKNFLEMAMRDYKYKTLAKFLKQVKEFLRTDGRIYMSFSDLGDIGYFEKLLNKYKLKVKILGKLEDDLFTKYIYELKFA